MPLGWHVTACGRPAMDPCVTIADDRDIVQSDRLTDGSSITKTAEAFLRLASDTDVGIDATTTTESAPTGERDHEAVTCYGHDEEQD